MTTTLRTPLSLLLAVAFLFAQATPSHGGVSNTDSDDTGRMSVQTMLAERLAVESDGTAQSGGEVISPLFNVKTHGAKGDGTTAKGCSVSAGAAALTCSGGAFVSADASKKVIVPGAGASGADFVTTISAVTGGTTATLAARASTNVSGKEAVYGTDDTSALQSAINAVQTAGGGQLVLPDGVYLTSGNTVTTPNIQFRGRGWNRTIIRNVSTTATTIDVSSAVASYGTAGGVYDIAFTPAVTRTTTATEIQAVVALPNFGVEGCLFQGVGRAMKFGSARAITSGYWVQRCRYINCWQFLKLVRVIDGVFGNIVGDMGRLDKPVAIHLDGNTEGNSFYNLLIVNATCYNTYQSNQAAAAGGGTNILSDMDEYTALSPAHNSFVNCYFDSAADGAVFNDGRDFWFSGCWFNGSYRYGANVGAATDGFSFVNCRFWYSGDSGLLLTGNRHSVQGSYAVSNGTRTGGGVARAGFDIACDNFIFKGNFAFNGWGGANSQAYGLVIEASSDHFIVKDNILRGNTMQGLLNNSGTGAAKIVSDNITS